eukprot:gene811-135_t
MGASESIIPDVRVTDAKAIVKHKCLQRKDYLAMQARASTPCGDPFGKNNIYPFLDKNVIKQLIPYLFGSSLAKCMTVCPLWFVSFLQSVDDLCEDIDTGFSIEYSNALEFEYARTDWSPIHTNDAAVRVDRVIIAKVKPKFVGRCLNISYSYKRNSSQSDRHHVTFKVDVLQQGRRRDVWLHKDMTPFHGDETKVANTQTVSQVCVGDRVEIAVSLFNAQGLVNIDDIKWNPLASSPERGFTTPIEAEMDDWFSLDQMQPFVTVKLTIPDFFGPQLRHCRTEFTGIDVCHSRTLFEAYEQGIVETSDTVLGERGCNMTGLQNFNYGKAILCAST